MLRILLNIYYRYFREILFLISFSVLNNREKGKGIEREKKIESSYRINGKKLLQLLSKKLKFCNSSFRDVKSY